MASYHRILAVYGRSVEDSTLQCDCDIHPWEILVNGKRWSGKIRLVGFVDVFFLIRYGSNSRFEHGIIVYKDEKAIVDTLKHSSKTPSDLGLRPVNLKTDNEGDEYKDPPQYAYQEANGEHLKYFQWRSDIIDYVVMSIGHEIGLSTKVPLSSLKKHEIKVRKHPDPLLKRRMKRAIRQHDSFDMIEGAVKSGIIDAAELGGHALGHLLMGGVMEDAGNKWAGGITSSQRSATVRLAGDET